MTKVRVIPPGHGEKVELPGNSWSLQMVNANTAGSTRAMLGISTFTPGFCSDPMIHEEEEMCYVLQGKGCLHVGEETVEYRAGDAVFIPVGVPHAVHNTGHEDVVMVFVFSSPIYPPTQKL